MTDRSNTDHDEERNRREFHGCWWLGVESMRAPQHRPGHWLSQLRGTRSATLDEARARAGHRR